MKVCFLSQWLPDNVDGVIGGLPRALAARGFDVEIRAGNNLDLANGWLIPESGPRFRSHASTAAGFPVTRYPFFRRHTSNAVERVAMYASFSASAAIGVVTKPVHADITLVYGSPGTAGLPALASKYLDRVPYVFLTQDVWPDSVFASGMAGGSKAEQLGNQVLNPMMHNIYRNAEMVLGISRGMAELLGSRGVPESKLNYIYNWAPETALDPYTAVPDRVAGEPLRLMYGGNIGAMQNLSLVLQAMTHFEPHELHLTLYGGGLEKDALRAEAAELGLTNVDIFDGVPQPELVSIMKGAHMHLVSLKPSPLFDVTVPSKFQFLLGMGAPVLGMVRGEVHRLITESGSGISTEALDVDGVVSQLRKATTLTTDQLNTMSQAARNLYLTEMSEQVNADKLANLLIESVARYRGRFSQ